MAAKTLLAIDQGTTSSRAILFDKDFAVLGIDQMEHQQHYPQSGWVEQDAEDIWNATLRVVKGVLAKTGVRPDGIAAIGIANQRETSVIWDRITGEPIHNAIVWQDRRTADICATLKQKGLEPEISAKTGLLLDPYFSATKIGWILDHVPGARARAEKGELAFGTMDTFLLWRLTGGRVHATDATNASRTLLYDLKNGVFDRSLCEIFRVPMTLLPEIRDSSGHFGDSDPALFGGAIPIAGMVGDQQAAAIGQACLKPGMMKITYGTGGFMVLNTGDEIVASRNRLLTTVAYQLDGKRTYALEGSIFIAGAIVTWLRDELGVVRSASEMAGLASAADPSQKVVLVPAFVGLGAPYWNPDVRGALFGLTLASSSKEIVRATLESIGYQTHDLLEAMRGDWPAAGESVSVLRADGGMAANDWLLQFLADILNIAVDRPKVLETTALGAAYLAGLAVGISPDPDRFVASWRKERSFMPALPDGMRREKLAMWRDAVARVLRGTAG